MKLFRACRLRAGDHPGGGTLSRRGTASQAIIEKDYYVTEALRIIAQPPAIRSSSRAAPACRRAGT